MSLSNPPPKKFSNSTETIARHRQWDATWRRLLADPAVDGGVPAEETTATEESVKDVFEQEAA